jgi:hypothetical protein
MRAQVEASPAEALLCSAGDLSVFIAGAEQIPSVLREIGRLREIAFRAAERGDGQGFGLGQLRRKLPARFRMESRRVK